MPDAKTVPSAKARRPAMFNVEKDSVVEPIKILIADHDPVVRRSLRLLLQREHDMTVVGDAADGLEAVALAGKACPNVVLMDLSMPRIDGIEATRLVKQTCPAIHVIILTVFADRLLEALLAGANDYLLKDCSREELLAKIRQGLDREKVA